VRLKFVLIVLAAVALAGCGARPAASLPVSPLHGCDVRDCGAVNDGLNLDTPAIQSAIDRVAAGGGGVIEFPPGRYLTGTLFLRTGVHLHLQKDAVLVGSTNFFDYYNLFAVDWVELPKTRYFQDESRFSGIIVSLNQHDIAVTGDGTIDGQGTVVAANIHQLQEEGLVEGNPKARPDESLRPTLMNFVRCQNVTVTGIHLKDAACWCEVYCDCDGVDVKDVTVRSRAYWNNDGIDICGSRKVRVSGLDAECADDAICLKSNATACENVSISHCRVNSWANGIKLGTVSCVGFEHISIDHVDVTGAGHSGVTLESVDGGNLQDVTVSDVTMNNVTQGIFVKLGDRGRHNGVAGQVHDITLRNITGTLNSKPSDGVATADEPYPPNPRGFPHNCFPCGISGFPGHPVTDVTIENVRITTPGGGTTAVADAPLNKLLMVAENDAAYPEYSMHGELPAVGWYCRHVEKLTMRNIDVIAQASDYRPAYLFEDVAGLDCRHFSAEGVGPVPLVAVRDVTDGNLADGSTDGHPPQVLKRLGSQSDVKVSNVGVR
jgi:polygalacturonase